MKVAVNISKDRILRRRGLNDGGFAQTWFTNECMRQMDPYVPMQTGTLKNSAQVMPDNQHIKYRGPYAHYLYHGKLFVTESGSTWAKKGEQKHETNTELTYHGAPKRGKLWDVRMWADKKQSILTGLTKITGGRAR